MGSCGWLWMIAEDCRCLRVVAEDFLGGCGWFWMVVGGCGWL